MFVDETLLGRNFHQNNKKYIIPTDTKKRKVSKTTKARNLEEDFYIDTSMVNSPEDRITHIHHRKT